MKDQKRESVRVRSSNARRSDTERCAREALDCDVCLSQGEPCAAMAQYLVSGHAETMECELIKHCF